MDRLTLVKELLNNLAMRKSGGFSDPCQRSTEQFGTVATREGGGLIGSCQRSTEQFSEWDISCNEGKRSID